jgi:hypothetical protein
MANTKSRPPRTAAPAAPRLGNATVWDVLDTAMRTENAARRLTLLAIPPVVALLGTVALVVVFLGPVGVAALASLLGGTVGARYLRNRRGGR